MILKDMCEKGSCCSGCAQLAFGPKKFELELSCSTIGNIRKKYYQGFQESFAQNSEVFFKFPASRLAQPYHGVAIVSQVGEVLAGTYFAIHRSDQSLLLHFKGLYSTGGMAAYMLARVSKAIGENSNFPVEAMADIRVHGDGRCNVPSAGALTKLGFFPEAVITHELVGCEASSHLIQRSSNGMISTLRMRVTPQRLTKSGEAIISQIESSGYAS
jgi:hypothetical protein